MGSYFKKGVLLLAIRKTSLTIKDLPIRPRVFDNVCESFLMVLLVQTKEDLNRAKNARTIQMMQITVSLKMFLKTSSHPERNISKRKYVNKIYRDMGAIKGQVKMCLG